MTIGDFDHLLLLIGTNPIPNYVVARYLLEEAFEMKKKPIVHFLRTTEMKDVTDRIIDGLDKHFRASRHGGLFADYQFSKKHLIHNAYQPGMVHDDIVKEVGELKGKIHLNHTGGTKSMAVEGAIVASENYPDRLTRSYLNPQSLTLDVGNVSYPDGSNLCSTVSPSLGEILALHGCKGIHSDQPMWNTAAEQMNAALHDADFDKWRQDVLKPMRRVIDNKKRSLNHLNLSPREQDRRASTDWAKSQSSSLDWTAYPEMAKVLTELRHDRAAPLTSLEPQQWNVDEAVRFVRFISGGWLEALVYGEVDNHSHWDEVKLSCYAVHQGALQHREMEIDVLARHGYGLTLFSCTTSDGEKEIKLKCFEAIHRAQQLGGEEAGAVMVCTASRKTLIQLWLDLEMDHSGRPPLKFISKEGLRKLPDAIQGLAERRTTPDRKEVVVF